MFFESREQSSLSLQYFQLEIFNLLPFFCGAYLAKERFVSAVFHTITQWAYVRNADVHVIWIEGAIEHGGLSTFTYTGGNPFAWINVLEGLTDGMKVVGTAFCGQVLPITRLGSRFQEVAVFHKDHVGVEHLGEFFAITWRKGIAGSISFGYNDGRAIETNV